MSGRKSVLIAGVGSIGERHLRCFLVTGRAQVSICEINPALRQKIAQQYGVERTYASLEEALTMRPDAVVICTPAHLHIRMAAAAARAGAHLLIEKPLSTSLEGIEALQEDLAKSGRVASVAYVMRAHPALCAMRQALMNGRFGEPVHLVATHGQNFPFYRPTYRETYYSDRATGGGAVQDALTHIVNAGEWLVGPIDRLVADSSHQVLEGVEVEDTVNVLTRHGQAMGCFSLNQHQAANEGTLTVICKGGMARFESHHDRWRWMVEPGSAWHDEPTGALQRDALFERQAAAFLDAVDGEKHPACPLPEAIQTLRVNLAILASAKARQWKSL
jgi:predicted dehydrogenase